MCHGIRPVKTPRGESCARRRLIYRFSEGSFGPAPRKPLFALPFEGKRTAAMGADARLTELKLELPPAPQPVATYLTAVRHGDLLYVSGHGPLRSDKTMIT